jgi:hypothetical protein
MSSLRGIRGSERPRARGNCAEPAAFDQDKDPQMQDFHVLRWRGMSRTTAGFRHLLRVFAQDCRIRPLHELAGRSTACPTTMFCRSSVSAHPLLERPPSEMPKNLSENDSEKLHRRLQ